MSQKWSGAVGAADGGDIEDGGRTGDVLIDDPPGLFARAAWPDWAVPPGPCSPLPPMPASAEPESRLFGL